MRPAVPELVPSARRPSGCMAVAQLTGHPNIGGIFVSNYTVEFSSSTSGGSCVPEHCGCRRYRRSRQDHSGNARAAPVPTGKSEVLGFPAFGWIDNPLSRRRPYRRLLVKHVRIAAVGGIDPAVLLVAEKQFVASNVTRRDGFRHPHGCRGCELILIRARLRLEVFLFLQAHRKTRLHRPEPVDGHVDRLSELDRTGLARLRRRPARTPLYQCDPALRACAASVDRPSHALSSRPAIPGGTDVDDKSRRSNVSPLDGGPDTRYRARGPGRESQQLHGLGTDPSARQGWGVLSFCKRSLLHRPR